MKGFRFTFVVNKNCGSHLYLCTNFILKEHSNVFFEPKPYFPNYEGLKLVKGCNDNAFEVIHKWFEEAIET